VYVPNAEVLTDGGFFGFNEQKDGYDTPESAKYILHNVLASHKESLSALRMPDGSRSLEDVARAGLEAKDLAGPVDSVLDLIEELKLQEEVRLWRSLLPLHCYPVSCCHMMSCQS
jgi:hypothetical protein